eukprot:SAG22_NODE_527_length_9437_cov_3.575712_2_plen_50_part_00
MRPTCGSAAVLVDVHSELAQLKFGLMELFEADGFDVDRAVWGSTAHITL